MAASGRHGGWADLKAHVFNRREWTGKGASQNLLPMPHFLHQGCTSETYPNGVVWWGPTVEISHTMETTVTVMHLSWWRDWSIKTKFISYLCMIHSLKVILFSIFKTFVFCIWISAVQFSHTSVILVLKNFLEFQIFRIFRLRSLNFFNS